MTDSNDHNVGGEASGHDNNTALFLKVFGALCVLTAISFAIASSPLMEQRTLAWASMMVVSCAKAFLVISFFMHLKWERAWKYVLTIPASIMSIFLVISLIPDIGLRTEAYSDSRWLHASEPVSASVGNGVESADEPETSEVDGAADESGDDTPTPEAGSEGSADAE